MGRSPCLAPCLSRIRLRVQGVLGSGNAPLNQMLEQHFGAFPMDWTTYAVPRLGGAILEAFNTDAVLALPPPQRAQTADTIAGRVVHAILAADSLTQARQGAIEDGCSATGCVVSDTY